MHTAAFNYLGAIKEKEYYEVVMASLLRARHKLYTISEKMEASNSHHEELHFEAIAVINPALKESVEDAVNTLL